MNRLNSFFGLQIGLRALQTNQAAIDVTGNNIANASTTGYSREVVDLTETDPYTPPAFDAPVMAGQMGTGVQVAQIQRMRDTFTDSMYREQTGRQNFYTAQNDVLSKIQAVVNEPSSTGLSNALQSFFTAWQQVSQDPSASNRAVLAQDTGALTDMLHSMSSDLTQLNTYINQTVSANVDSVNSLTSQIAALNGQIQAVEANKANTGQNANTLRDQRDVLIDQLSQYGAITVNEAPATGMDTITMGNMTTPLVSGTTANALTAATDANGNKVVDDSSGTQVDLGYVSGSGSSTDDNSGLVQGYIAARDGATSGSNGSDLTAQINNLNILAQQLATSVNAQQTQGYDTSGNPGGNFFTSGASPTVDASNIELNPLIAANTDLIAAASSTPAAAGDGGNALKIANLQSAFPAGTTFVTGFPSTQTFSGFWQTSVFNLGLAGQTANSQETSYQAMVSQLDNQRQQTSGVSNDQEMTNLLQYQHGYEAAARVINTEDSMLDTIVTGLGVITA